MNKTLKLEKAETPATELSQEELSKIVGGAFSISSSYYIKPTWFVPLKPGALRW